MPQDHHNARKKVKGRRWGKEKISNKKLRFQWRAGKSLFSLQVSHNMYQIQSVNNGHFFPSPQPRWVFAKLRALALPQVSKNPPAPEGSTLSSPWRDHKVSSGQRKYEHGFRSPEKCSSLCPIRNDLILLNKAVNPVRKLMKWSKTLAHFCKWLSLF